MPLKSFLLIKENIFLFCSNESENFFTNSTLFSTDLSMDFGILYVVSVFNFTPFYILCL